MADITLKGGTIHTSGSLPEVGSTAKAFTLVDQALGEVTLETHAGKTRVLNIFPSVDTGICAKSVKVFHEQAAAIENLVVLNISADLPFAHKRFCGAEGVDNAVSLSTFRSSFAQDYGLEIIDGPMRGLCSRAVIVVDGEGKVTYTEQVPEIVQEPNYDAALAAAK